MGSDYAAAFFHGAATAKGKEPKHLTANAKAQFTAISGFVTRSAEKIPENLYSFQATPEVRTVAQLLGYIADAYFAMCSAAAGSKPPQSGIENSASTRAALLKGAPRQRRLLSVGMDAMIDQKGSETVPFYFGPTPRLGILFFVTTHTYEPCGNLVTYMRLNKTIPPSSETPTTR